MWSTLCALKPRSARPALLLASSSLASSILIGLSATASAQSTAAAAIVLPSITVDSATGIPTPIEQIGSSVTVITAEELERDQRRTVPDALRAVPGLNVVQAGGPGNQTSIFMRGTNANHVKILIDGIDVSDPSNPGRQFDLGHMLTGDIERIEVLRGPQSGLYGADALGGVISITTKKGEGPPKARAMLEGGSFGTFNQNASLSGSQKQSSGANANYAFNVQHLRTTDTPVTPDRVLPPGQARNNDSYDNKTFSSRLGLDLNDNLSFNWAGRYTESTLHFTSDDFDPLTFTSVPGAERSKQDVHQFFSRSEAVVSLFDGRFKNYFGVNYTNHWNWSALPGATPTLSKGDRTKFDWRGVAQIMPGQTMVFGLEHDIETIETSTTDASNGNKAGYIELQSEFARRIFLVANLRYDDNDRFGGHTTYRVAPAVILPMTETKLKGSIGTGFKAPTLSQMFVDFPAFSFFGNPNLKPETSVGYDYGFEQPVLNNRIRFGVTYFHNSIKDLIVSQTDLTTFTATNVNVNRATTQGYEAFVTWAVTERLRLRGDYTYTRAIDDMTGLDLQRRPRHKWSATAAWKPVDPLELSATFIAVSSWRDDFDRGNINTQPRKGYQLVNLAANYTVNEHAKVFARIDNLFDYHYEEPTGFLRPGFGIFGGVRISN